MKLMKVATVVLAAALLLCAAVIEMAAADKDPATNISGFCKDKCAVRCSKASRQQRCLFYCGICCTKCNCVPPGTYGNRDACPCYRDLKNSKGQPKCP